VLGVGLKSRKLKDGLLHGLGITDRNKERLEKASPDNITNVLSDLNEVEQHSNAGVPALKEIVQEYSKKDDENKRLNYDKFMLDCDNKRLTEHRKWGIFASTVLAGLTTLFGAAVLFNGCGNDESKPKEKPKITLEQRIGGKTMLIEGLVDGQWIPASRITADQKVTKAQVAVKEGAEGLLVTSIVPESLHSFEDIYDLIEKNELSKKSELGKESGYEELYPAKAVGVIKKIAGYDGIPKEISDKDIEEAEKRIGENGRIADLENKLETPEAKPEEKPKEKKEEPKTDPNKSVYRDSARIVFDVESTYGKAVAFARDLVADEEKATGKKIEYKDLQMAYILSVIAGEAGDKNVLEEKDLPAFKKRTGVSLKVRREYSDKKE